MKHPTAIDAHEVELRRAKQYLDEYADRPERWICVKLLRRVLKTGFAAIHEIEQASDAVDPHVRSTGKLSTRDRNSLSTN